MELQDQASQSDYANRPRILELENLRFRGLRVYAASGVLNVEDLLQNCQLVLDTVGDIESKFTVRCDIIDFGGGFGIDYLETGKDFSPEAHAKGLQNLIDQFGLDQFGLNDRVCPVGCVEPGAAS